MFTNEIRPYQCHADHRRKTCDAVNVAQVCVLDVESGGLHCPETCLNLQSLFVCCHGTLMAIVANQDLQLRHAIGVLQHGSGNIYIFPFEKEEFVVDSFLSGLEAVKQMPRPNIFSGFGITQPKILLDTRR